MRSSLLLFIMVLCSARAVAFNSDFSVSRIPVTLLRNSDAVLRIEESRFEIRSVRSATHNFRYVITVLNERGNEWADFSEHYDKLRKIVSVQGILYDANGKQLKKIKTKDLQDISGTSDINLTDDNRIKQHNFYYRTYPYTVEYLVEIEYDYTLFFPMWVPQGGERLSVEKSSVSIVCPEEYQFRYKAFGYKGEPQVTQEKGKRISTWSVSNLPAFIREPYQPQLHEFSTVVLFGPTDFKVGDYLGNMKSWEDFGKFIHELKKDKDVLPENVKKQVHELVSGIEDKREKVKKLYKYMQQNTRYISIQLGIGGWQPFDAKFVASRSYGDCKALTNYMYSILKEVGINSAYTVVRAGNGSNYITKDFPSQQFNHVILCVPMEKDSLWLECTSQTDAAGYMGGFTGNRVALMIDESGGKLVSTPRYGLNENIQTRKVKAKLSDDASLNFISESRYHAMQQDNLHMQINNLSREKLKERLQSQLDFPTYEINDFSYKEYKHELPFIDETLDVVVRNFATITGKRLFIQPNVMTKSHSRLTRDDARKYDVQLSFSFQDVDTVEIEIPAGYISESKPDDVNISNKFGKYSSSVKVSGNKIYYYRKLEQYDGRFPAADYNLLVDFYDQVYKADRNRLVLVKEMSN